jgi:lipopolysaccharide export LptBFGC system permease protein LptF
MKRRPASERRATKEIAQEFAVWKHYHAAMRLPLTLWRAMTFDVLRLTAVSAGVLVCVVAFAATMKYLVDGRLEPGDALRFMLLTIPPMLAHVLPFAGGFAATLVYHRMATDNEMLAANAGGLSHKAMLVPCLIAALLMGGSLAYMNEQAIPRFLREMQRLVTMEAPRLLANEVQRGRSVKLGNLIVYADGALRSETRGKDWNPDVRDHVSLSKMLAIEVDANGAVKREFFAKQADLWFMSDAASRQAGLAQGVSLMHVRLKSATTMSPEEGVNRAGFKDEVTYSWTVPQVLSDNPKYLTFSELRNLRKVPEGIDYVESRRRALAYLLAKEAAAAEIGSALKSSGQVSLLDRNGSAVILRAAALDRKDDSLALRPTTSGEIELEFRRGTNGQRSIVSAKKAELRLDASGTGASGRLSVGVDMTTARTRAIAADGSDRVGGENEKASFREMVLPSRPENRYLSLGSYDVSAAAAEVQASPGSAIDATNKELRREIGSLMRRVTAKQHERWALAVACLLMVMTGSLTALKFQGSLPLTVYLASFVPALACIVTISGGQQTVTDAGLPGLILLWGGVVGLGAYAYATYRKVARH